MRVVCHDLFNPGASNGRPESPEAMALCIGGACLERAAKRKLGCGFTLCGAEASELEEQRLDAEESKNNSSVSEKPLICQR